MICPCGKAAPAEAMPLCHRHWVNLPEALRSAWIRAAPTPDQDRFTELVREYTQLAVSNETQAHLMAFGSRNEFVLKRRRDTVAKNTGKQAAILVGLTNEGGAS